MAQKINLNTASRDELANIPGIGAECADIIVEHREKKGRIEDVEEFAQVPGFGQKALQHLRENAEV